MCCAISTDLCPFRGEEGDVVEARESNCLAGCMLITVPEMYEVS